MGDESLDVDEVGIGLDGAENMGQDGERGEVGLGFGGLQDITTKKLVSTQGVHGINQRGFLVQNKIRVIGHTVDKGI